MLTKRWTYILVIATFLLGFGLGGFSFHYASAQGLLGLKSSISDIGTALVEMQKNVDELQKNMGSIKKAKDQLSTLSPEGGGTIKQGGDSLKKLIPGMGQ